VVSGELILKVIGRKPNAKNGEKNISICQQRLRGLAEKVWRKQGFI